MKKIIIASMLLSSSAFASGISIDSFSIVRKGGGQLETIIYQANNQVYAYTVSCNFKDNSQEQQSLSTFALSGTEAQEASYILNNSAVLASKESITHPFTLTGTWLSADVQFRYTQPDGSVKVEIKSIKEPIVIINSKVSDILNRIENQVRANSICK